MAKEAAVIMTDLGEIRFGKNDKIAAVQVGSHGLAFVARDGRIERFDANDLPDEMQEALKLHGLKQKLKDAHAALVDSDECMEASLRVFGQLSSGVWAGVGIGGGDTSLLEALVAVTGGDREEIRAKLKEMKPAEREALRLHPPIKAELDRRAAEKAKGIDVAGLLGKLV
jgi:hypothetical protein